MVGVIDSLSIVCLFDILGNECSPTITLKHHIYHCEFSLPIHTNRATSHPVFLFGA